MFSKRFLCALCTWLLCFSAPVFAGTQETELINLLNQDRKAKGRKPLKISTALTKAAENHAQDMVSKGYFSHTGKDGSSVGKRIKRQGYKFCYAAENIAFGQKTAEAAMVSWRNSSGHKKNNLSKKTTEVGAGFAGEKMWVLVFAKPC
jgi:uncharacterized protein YkwD